MKRTKAIEILSLDLTYSYPAHFTDLQDAIQLAITDMTFVQRLCACSIKHSQALSQNGTPTIGRNIKAEEYKKILESPLGRKPTSKYATGEALC